MYVTALQVDRTYGLKELLSSFLYTEKQVDVVIITAGPKIGTFLWHHASALHKGQT